MTNAQNQCREQVLSIERSAVEELIEEINMVAYLLISEPRKQEIQGKN